MRGKKNKRYPESLLSRLVFDFLIQKCGSTLTMTEQIFSSAIVSHTRNNSTFLNFSRISAHSLKFLPKLFWTIAKKCRHEILASSRNRGFFVEFVVIFRLTKKDQKWCRFLLSEDHQHSFSTSIRNESDLTEYVNGFKRILLFDIFIVCHFFVLVFMSSDTHFQPDVYRVGELSSMLFKLWLSVCCVVTRWFYKIRCANSVCASAHAFEISFILFCVKSCVELSKRINVSATVAVKLIRQWWKCFFFFSVVVAGSGCYYCWRLLFHYHCWFCSFECSLHHSTHTHTCNHISTKVI